jgi:hypothetical protein
MAKLVELKTSQSLVRIVSARMIAVRIIVLSRLPNNVIYLRKAPIAPE